MNGLIKPLYEMNEFNLLLSDIKKGLNPVAVNGLSGSSKSHIVYSVYDSVNKPVMLITYNDMEAKTIYEDLCFFTDKVYYLPSREAMLYDIEAVSWDIASERLKVINGIMEGDNCIVVTSVDNIAQRYIDPNIVRKYSLKFKVGDVVNLSDIINTFIIAGYERVDIVEGKGQFSIRGGIIDFFPMICDKPYRMELFDVEIDSIRQFDVLSQRSTEKVNYAQIFPAREMIVSRETIQKAYEKIKNDAESQIKNFRSKKNKEAESRLRTRMGNIAEKLKESIYFEGIDSFFPYFYSRSFTLFDFFKDKPLVMVDEPQRVIQRIDTQSFEFQELYKTMLEKGNVMPLQGELLYPKGEVLGSIRENKLLTLNLFPKNVENFRPVTAVNFYAVSIHSYDGKIELLIEDIKDWKLKKYKVVILSGTPAKGRMIAETLREKGIETAYYDVYPEDILPEQIIITNGAISEGFEYPAIHFAVVSDREIFGEKKHRRRFMSQSGVSSKIKNFTDLKIGDYVVHVNHGIGIFQGIRQLTVDGIKRDYLDIRYASGDKLYVPVEQLDLVQKYIGSEGKPPKIYKLGGTEWSKAKVKVKESIKKMAEDLVKLYAIRQKVEGHAFSADTPWQAQFEEEFPYEETPDQLTAIEEIKRDMESKRPMDRLLCGDVGYGKTEVALRAAFKAVMDGKQVAFLVPTTILAEQHYNNFMQRFADFPVKVDMISRFRSSSQQKKTLRELKEGSIDILVGTHRLLQKDVVFKDLGLLIIDEEQRFGVAHKEKIKNIKKNVDVLTLTATPIPRTLHMSLLNVRDMSIIETPPEERYPVSTYVLEFNEQLIRDAILRELNRGGQVYFVYNRVESIKDMFARLSSLVPEARIGIGHGQMSEHELENVMESFLKREYDVLLCTTIIETGLDIPNVNTLVVYDSDKMGLSQLYQLRGRVGRSNRMAYAYLTYRKDKVLAEVAEKRLEAIKEFTEFGSGFKIAMRDLEIRGAGNMLGAEQHGHMEAVGYDMYCRLIQETVNEIKGEVSSAPVETSVDISINAYIDSSYISDETQKIEIYKKIASIRDIQDMYDIQEEVEDRFGDIPCALQNLLKVAYIKSVASKCGISAISQKGDIINLYCNENISLISKNMIKLAGKFGKVLLFNSSKVPYFSLKVNKLKDDEILKLLQELLGAMNNLQVVKTA